MTELQQNFKTIAERMQRKYKEKEDLFHYAPCLIPAWEPLIDKIIAVIESWNSDCAENHKIRIFQMKEKFGSFVVYLEPYNGNGEGEIPDHIRTEVNDIASQGAKLCRVCGKKKVQIVVESRLQWRCLDHWEGESRWRVRE